MSFLKKLFGGGAPREAAPPPTAEHKGYVITATPMEEGGQFQICGLITREVDGAPREYKFIRVDRFGSKTDAVDMIFQKGRQIIDERGVKMFD